MTITQSGPLLKRTIASLALVKANAEIRGRDFIENFVPFIATLIRDKSYTEVDVHRICSDFSESYGLSIPYHPMIAILNRAASRGILQKSSGKFIPVMEKVVQWDMTPLRLEQERRIGAILNGLIDHAQTKYSVKLSSSEAEAALVGYLKIHDLDILCASQVPSVLPEVKPSRRGRFLVASYVKYASSVQPDKFKWMIDTAIGHVLACAILYDTQSFSGKLTSVNLYLDTMLLLRILGAEGKARQVAYEEFVRVAKKNGANVKVFRHTYDEAMGILENCRQWVGKQDYDPSKASPALRHFVAEGVTTSDVDLFIARVPEKFREHNIIVADEGMSNDQQKYQIAEGDLRVMIVEEYKRLHPSFEAIEKEFTLQRDINSISAVHRLRQGQAVHSLPTSGHIFLTNNATLAYACKRFEREKLRSGDSVPACLTDTFLGTMLWLESPIESSGLSAKRMIADCTAALQPDAILLRKLVFEAKKLLDEKKVTPNEFLALRGSRVAYEMLAEKTLCDPDAFTDKTALEVIEDMRREAAEKGEAKYQEEKAQHDITRQERDNALKVISDLDTRADRWALAVTRPAYWFILLFLGSLLIIVNAIGILRISVTLRIIFFAIGTAIDIVSTLFGFNLARLRERFRLSIRAKFIHLFGLDQTEQARRTSSC